MSFAFHSQSTFLKCAPLGSEHRFGVAGIAWDGAVTNRPGARFGPRAIREASHMLCDATHAHFGVSPVAALGDAGDLELPNTSIERHRAQLSVLVPPFISQHHMVWLGGDHSITLPLLRAHAAALGHPVAVIHFDTHCDTWSDHFGEPSGHGTWVHEAFTGGLVVPSAFVQIGLRSPAEPEAIGYVPARGGRVFTARDLRGLVSPAQLQGVVGEIRARLQEAGNPPVYLTLDIDCLDPAFAPGTGTPEPGGLCTSQVLTLIEELADLPFIGMDCVEVAPPYDHSEMTSHAAAAFVWTYLAAQCKKPRGAAP